MSSVLCLFEEVNLLTSLPLSSVNGAEKPLHDHLPIQCPVTSNAEAAGTDAGPNIAAENVRTTRAMRMEGTSSDGMIGGYLAELPAHKKSGHLSVPALLFCC